MADRRPYGSSYLKAHAAHGVDDVNTVGVPRQINQFRLGPAKGRLPQAYHLILPCGARKAVKSALGETTVESCHSTWEGAKSHDYGSRRLRWYTRPQGREIVCAHGVRGVRAHSRPSLWVPILLRDLLDARVHGAQSWNARDSVELASDAATPYVAVVIGQKISAGAKQEQKP